MAIPTNDSANQFTSENFLNPYGVFEPQKRRSLMYFQSEEFFALDIFQEIRMSEPVLNRQFSYFIEPKKVVNVVASAAVAASATNATADIIINETAGIAGGVYIRGREVLRRKNGQQLVVLAINKSTRTMTVKAAIGSNVTAVASGEVFTIIGNASPEGSSPRKPMTGVPREVTNQLQIMQEIAEASGSVQTDKTWFKVDVPDAMSGNVVTKEYWFAWEIGAAWDRLTNQRSRTLISGQSETYDLGNLVTNFGENAVSTMYTTGSVMSQAAAEGNTKYYTNGSLDMTWYNQLENTLLQKEADRENIFFVGLNFSQQNASWILDQFKNGAISYGAFNESASMMSQTSPSAAATSAAAGTETVAGKALAIKMGFTSFTSPQGFTAHWKVLPELNDPNGLGEQGLSYYALIIPTQPFRTSTGKMSKPLRQRYKTLPNGGQVATGFRNSTRNTSSPTSNGDFDSVETIVEEGMENITPWKSFVIQPQ